MPTNVPKRREKRLAFFNRAERMTPFLAARIGGGVYVVSTRDKNVGRSLYVGEGRSEMNVLGRAITVLEAIFGPGATEGKTFVDVGANIGTTTVPAVLEHGFASAVALEPEAENHKVLQLNVLLNGLDDRVVTLCQAASNEDGTAELIVNHEQAGKHWIAVEGHKNVRMRDEDESVEVETVTLNALVKEGVLDPDRIGLLWMDAQFHEGHILAGASELTGLGVPIVLEMNPRGLDKLGDRGKIEEIAQRDYTHFAGMRAQREGPKFTLRPIAELPEYSERLLDSEREASSDILLMRLAEGEVPEGDLSELINLASVTKRESEPERRRERERERAEKSKDLRLKEKSRQIKAKRGKAKVERTKAKAKAARTEQRREKKDGEANVPEE